MEIFAGVFRMMTLDNLRSGEESVDHIGKGLSNLEESPRVEGNVCINGDGILRTPYGTALSTRVGNYFLT